MANELDLSWMPAWVPGQLLEAVRGTLGESGSARPVRFLRPAPGSWASFCRQLDSAARAVREISIDEVVEAIDVVSARWADRSWPVRAATTRVIAEATGFSAEAVARSLDLELRNYRAPSLRATLTRELGDPRVLDEQRPASEIRGWTRAFGPRAILAILTGNVPGLPALAIVRALLVKSPVVIKVASGEPSFASCFVRSLHEVEPRLADAIAVTYWGRNEGQVLAEAVASFDTVMVYGGDDVCESVRRLVSSKQRFVEHGHRVSVGILSRKYVNSNGLARIASEVARDMSTFNQHACIAPQAYLVEGGDDEVAAVGEALAEACRMYTAECPLGELSPRDAATHQLRRADLAWRAASDGLRAWFDPDGEWSIVMARDFGGDSSAGNRVLRLIGVSSIDDAIERITHLSTYLQNVGLGAMREELPRAAEQLGTLGASRICQPGRMAEPSMMWKHDGRACVSELLRWCDVEMHDQVERPEWRSK